MDKQERKAEYKPVPAWRYLYVVRWNYYHKERETYHEGDYKYFADFEHALQYSEYLATVHKDYSFAALLNEACPDWC